MSAWRVVVLQTHPVQYMAPWFRYVAAERPEIDLTVLYASVPSSAQQGEAFGGDYAWDVPLTDGYRHEILAPPDPRHRFDSDTVDGVDAPGLDDALARLAPDAVVVPGWHSAFYLRGIAACRRLGMPLVYRGDSSPLSAPGGWRRPLWRARTRRRLRWFTAYLSVGTRIREHLIAMRVPDALVFDSPAVVDNAFFEQGAAELASPGARAAARRELGAGPDDFLLLCAGRFIARKRPADAVAAAARLGAGVVLAMAGGGPLESALRETAERSGARVRWPGFLNQQALRRALAAADCVLVPSAWETWGLIVNEALAAGTPCVVSDHVGAAPDLVRPGVSGEAHAPGDVEGLAAAVGRVRDALDTGAITAETCRGAAHAHSFARATDGVTAALERLDAARRAAAAPSGDPRVLALCGPMVEIFGIERMTFEVLATLRARGAGVHCLVNRWGSRRIVDRADAIGASWSTIPLLAPLRRRPGLVGAARILWDEVRTSAGTLRAAYRQRPTHVLAADYTIVVRSAPALWLLRLMGTTVVLRLGNAPEPGWFYRVLWRTLIRSAVDRFVPNSGFTERELLACGVPASRSRVIYNAAPRRVRRTAEAARVPGRIIFVGQIIPPKGVDLLLEAVAALVARGVDATLDVVGDIDGWEPPGYAGYRRRVRDRAAAADLSGRVRLLGVREDVPDLMAAATVHCLPSRPVQREAFGVVVIEAKEAAVPSVATSYGAVPELITHRIDGWLCPEASADALAEGLEYFLADPERARTAGARARASAARFSREAFDAGWTEVFDLGPRGTPSAGAGRPGGGVAESPVGPDNEQEMAGSQQASGARATEGRPC